MVKRSRAGDVFVVPIGQEAEVQGQVLLSIKEQCIKPRLLSAESPLTFYADALLLRIEKLQPAIASLLPPIFTWPGEWQMTTFAPIAPEKVDFPQGLKMQGVTAGLIWGELWLPIDLKENDVNRIGTFPPIQGAGIIKELALHALDRVADIDPRYQEPTIFAASRLDIRASPHRDRVHSLLGRRIGASYFETALRYGYDVRRFYGTEHRERLLTLCPYCQAPFDPTSPTCAACDRDTRDDAPTDVTAQELATWDRMPCRACRTAILKNSVVCPGCKQPQTESVTS